MRKVSLKQAKRLREYNKARDEFLKDKTCQFPGCESEDVTLHHSRGRIGDNLTDVSTFRALYWHHHQYIELNPDVAKEWGLSESRLTKH
jgi:hypothetical protein